MKEMFYVSFASKAFLGAVIIEADGPMDALEQATMLGLNPGGEAAIMRGAPECARAHANRLLKSPAEIEAAFGTPVHRLVDMDERERNAIKSAVTTICENCNNKEIPPWAWN